MHNDRAHRLHVLVFVFAVVPLVASCGSDGDEREPRPEAPVSGAVKVVEGDCMPRLDPKHCRVRGLAVRVDAYPLIVIDERDRERSGLRVPDGAVPTQTTTSDSEGNFSFVLPEGRYTIVAFYEGSWYPNSKSSRGEWAAVEVNTAWLEEVTIAIDRATH